MGDLNHLDELLRQSQDMASTTGSNNGRHVSEMFTQDLTAWGNPTYPLDSHSFKDRNAIKTEPASVSLGYTYPETRKRTTGQSFNAVDPSSQWTSQFEVENFSSSSIFAPSMHVPANSSASGQTTWPFADSATESYEYPQHGLQTAMSGTVGYVPNGSLNFGPEGGSTYAPGYDDLMRPFELDTGSSPYTFPRDLMFPETMYTASSSSSSSSSGSSPPSSTSSPFIQSQSRYLRPSSPFTRSPSTSSRYSSPPYSISNSEYSETTAPDASRPRDRRRIPCTVPGCLRRFTSQYTLKVHVQAHKPKPRLSFPCTGGCSERFSRQHDRLRHEVSKHDKVCEWSCNECGRFFSTSKTLGNHKCPAANGGTRWVS